MLVTRHGFCTFSSPAYVKMLHCIGILSINNVSAFECFPFCCNELKGIAAVPERHLSSNNDGLKYKLSELVCNSMRMHQLKYKPKINLNFNGNLIIIKLI